MENDNLISRLFTYIVAVVAVAIGLWLTYKVDNLVHFLMYGIIALIIAGIILIAFVKIAISNCKNYNWIDFAFSLLILGLAVWCVFSACRLWL